MILKLFSAELQPYAGPFTVAAACLLLIAGMGPVIGLLQMTGQEQLCNRNQLISIGTMVAVWMILNKNPLFSVYALCVQAVVEGILEYYSVCKWFDGPVIPIHSYIIMWMPVALECFLVEALNLRYSFIALLVSMTLVGIWNLLFTLRDPLVKDAVAEALRNAGYQVKELDPDPTEGWSLPLGTEVVFLALHGTYGEDGQVQSELDRLGIPYTGSGAEASRIGFDKLLTRKHCEALGVKMPKAMLIDKEMDQLPEGWRLPVILKPLREGSSVGLQVVEREEDFFNAVHEVLKYGSQALMEDKISGRELTASILNGEALPLVELRPKSGIYDYKSKYTSGATEYICPAKISDILTMKVQEAALKTFYAVGARDYARVDMILDREGQCWVLEINTLPGMSTTSLLPKAAAAAGLNYEDLCSKMVELALKHSTVTS